MTVEITPSGTRGRRSPRGPLLRALLALNVGLYRLLRGRTPGPPMLLLTTSGARSGADRTVPLQYFAEGDDAWLVVASAWGGSRHPAWFRNLAAHPDRVFIEVRGRRLRVEPRSLHGEERAQAWRRITARASNFADYERQTDREIPVVRLTPAG